MKPSDLRQRLLPLAARRTGRPAITGNNRLLIVQPDHLGDIVLSEPAVRLLRRMLPDHELIAVVGPWSAEIAKMAWPVDTVVEVEFPAFTRASSSRRPLQPYQYLRDSTTRLRAIEADDALILRDDAWWAAWLARASVGRHVVTSDDPQTRLFATITARTPASVHRTELAAAIVSSFLSELRLNIYWNAWDMSPKFAFDPGELSDPLSPGSDAPDAPTIIIHPGSGAEVKSWPLHNWRALVRNFPDARVVLTGSTAERPLCDAIAEPFPHAMSIAGNTTLPGLAAALRSATVAVGTDNGPMHLAGALGVPTVRLFGPSNPTRYGPWPGTPGQAVIQAGWICPRCEDLSSQRESGCGCMLAITPERVVAAVREAIDGAA